MGDGGKRRSYRSRFPFGALFSLTLPLTQLRMENEI